ncbi:hypothetical protein H696_05936 [Fonticula alba]|uniref:Uncharacterized protein n=1 Tax=Fonticula alba TaxID=691883 RepID=A0A058Z054_FONAL|nr:hypothetical protein H696_05936 [Fonticula alba]KCV67649.1 hypothetical protein H696_05936 [Fonticula alba]|eukprot:XP_009497987.1 hypothetical protein H696_05936 [Fonticula alba]
MARAWGTHTHTRARAIMPRIFSPGARLFIQGRGHTLGQDAVHEMGHTGVRAVMTRARATSRRASWLDAGEKGQKARQEKGRRGMRAWTRKKKGRISQPAD